MRSPLKALYNIITPSHWPVPQLPGEHTAELRVKISATGHTDTFSACYMQVPL
jgi:hypothetical protein